MKRDRSPTGNPAIVAVGASAGGLDAARRFLEALPKRTDLAFILVHHLDPKHESLLVELLAPHTALTLQQAEEGIRIEPGHVYVIPPGFLLTVRDSALHLSPRTARRGGRLPFDFLLESLAIEYGARAMAVVLSGTGADGTQGALAIRAQGGFVVAQDPGEAAFDGMPRSAIMAGAVNLVLPVAAMPTTLLRHAEEHPSAEDQRVRHIVGLLQKRAAHDFTVYKPGTLRRRIALRVGISGCANLDAYIGLLERDAAELALLAKDLLIRVTGFFRDPAVFDLLGTRIVPEIVQAQPEDRPIRVWSAGCSTGEEAWSLAMLFQEAIAASGRNLKLQVFATDVDAEAVGIARHGFYAAGISAEITAERLVRFFSRENGGWRVRPELRAPVVFSVHDLLSDPPFSRLDLVSCRNLLIYLKPAAQARLIGLFHFALRPGGILLLGGSEIVGPGETGFEPLAKPERIWRRSIGDRPVRLGLINGGADAALRTAVPVASPPGEIRLAELCARLVLETYAPAAALVDAHDQCVYTLGPTYRYLGHASGRPTHNLVAMTRPALRTKLRAALHEARQVGGPISVDGGPWLADGDPRTVRLDLRPVFAAGEDFLLICFVDVPAKIPAPGISTAQQDPEPISALEKELEATRAELRSVIHSLETSSAEQRAINEDALSVAEEFQTTNEELLTSKEELQSLNEELTALNGQLQEALERSRALSNDLQNILYSTDIATLFLDPALGIRFFTPAMRVIFSLMPSDIGRPLADLRPLVADSALMEDAAAVANGTAELREQEIDTPVGISYSRRILPYRAQDGAVEGVVITFSDITDRKRTARALEEATHRAETANATKSHFLAAASHDLRQPLQTLTLLLELLSKQSDRDENRMLVTTMERTVSAMSTMLDTLLDINQLEAGMLHPELVAFPLEGLFERLRQEFGYIAASRGLKLRVVPCRASILTDPRLLEQLLRNILSNALKYTHEGRVLLGCRRQGNIFRIEVWDTGIGIPEMEQDAIFDEFHQVGDPARRQTRGIGLGLSIAKRLATLLGHRLYFRSKLRVGSVFCIEAALAETAAIAPPKASATDAPRTGSILVVEDDPDVRSLLVQMLTVEGFRAVATADAATALALVARGAIWPDLLLADYKLPKGIDGLRLASLLRERMQVQLPVIMLTADISTNTLRKIARLDCVSLHKPATAAELDGLIKRLLPVAVAGTVATWPGAKGYEASTPSRAVIHVVDDDPRLRDSLCGVLEHEGYAVIEHASGEAFLASYHPGGETCLLVDAQLPGMSGFDLLGQLRGAADSVPAIIVTGGSDVHAAVRAMKAGASDFIEKPVLGAVLIAAIEDALVHARDRGRLVEWRQNAAERIGKLTDRQHEVLKRVLAGEPSKIIAGALGISQRTVEVHRATIMRKTGARSLPDLARLALAAEAHGTRAELHT